MNLSQDCRNGSAGAAIQSKLSIQYGISPVMIGRWEKEYSTGKFFANAKNTDIADIKIRMSELERLVGELLLENKMLKKAKELDAIQKKRRFIDNNKFERKTIQGWCKIGTVAKLMKILYNYSKLTII